MFCLGVLFCFVFVHDPGQAGRGLTMTDGDATYHLGPLAKLSGLLIGKQLQLLIEFIWRHYRAGAARRAAAPLQHCSMIKYSSLVNAQSLYGCNYGVSGHRQHSIRGLEV